MIRSRSVKKMILVLFVAFCGGASAGTPALSDGSVQWAATATRTGELATDKPMSPRLSERKEVSKKQQKRINIIIGAVISVAFVGTVAAFFVANQN